MKSPRRRSRAFAFVRFVFWVGVVGLLASSALLVAHRWYRFGMFLPIGDRYIDVWIYEGELQLEWNLDADYIARIRQEEQLEEFEFTAGIVYWPMTVPHRKLLRLSHRGFIGVFGLVDVSLLWLVIAAACLTVVSALALRFTRRTAKVGSCRRCGYDLRGNVSGRCPECGAAVQQATKPGPSSPSEE